MLKVWEMGGAAGSKSWGVGSWLSVIYFVLGHILSLIPGCYELNNSALCAPVTTMFQPLNKPKSANPIHQN